MDADLLANIESAQSIRGIPPSEIMIPYPSIRSLLDSQVRRYGDRSFFCRWEDGENRDVSFNDFFNRVSRCANYLRREKVAFGDTVGVTETELYRSLVQLFGIWAVGGTAHLDSGDSLFPSEVHHFDDALNGESEVAEVGKKSKLADDCLKLKNESGRTVVLSHYNLIVNGMAISERLLFTDSDTLGSDGERIDLLTLAGAVMTALYAGCRIDLTGGTSSGKQICAIFAHRPESAANAECAVVPHIVSGDKRRGSVITGFFMPELTGFVSFESSPSDEEELIPVGDPLHPCEMAILDEEGAKLPEGQRGRLAVRGHNVMKGFSGDDDANHSIFAGGWLNTGSIAEARKNAEDGVSFFVEPDHA